MTFTLKIEKIVFGGCGLGYHESKTCFVFGSFVDDVVNVKVLYTKKNSYFCEIVEIVEPSKYRGETRCELARLCGACNWVNVDYDKQIEIKTTIYNNVFDNSKNDLLISESPVIDYYRNKCFYPVQLQDDKIVIGMYAHSTHDVVEHKHCFLYPKIFRDIVDDIKEWMSLAKVKPYDREMHSGEVRHIGFRYSADSKSIIVVLVTRTKRLSFTKILVRELTKKYSEVVGIVQNIQDLQTNVVLGTKEKVLYGDSYFIETLGGKSFKIDYNAFCQVNIQQALKVYNDIATFVNEGSVAIDAYSGIGFIANFVADKAKKVICIESNKVAVSCGIYNSKLNNFDNIYYTVGQTETVLENTIATHKPDTIIFDPPRRGLQKSVVETVSRHKIKIIYLSCDPVTQRRDIGLLKENGYKLTHLKGYDMFPHTWHIESLAVLEL